MTVRTSEKPIDLFIRNGLVVTMNDRLNIYQPGALAIGGDSIIAVGKEAETRTEEEQILRRYGVSPTRHLARLGLLDKNLIAVHCVVLSEADQDTLAVAGVKVAHCPESNMKLASGVAPVVELLRRGVSVGLGTDGCASNNNLDLFQEMDSAAKLHKVHHLDPTVMDARTVFRMATRGGARVLGMESRVGSLEAGKKADIIILNLDQPHLTPLYNIYSHLVYAARGADVTRVIIHGRTVMKDRELLTLDLKEILSRANRFAEMLRLARLN